MDAGAALKPKVTVKLTYKSSTASFRQPLEANVHSRPASPTKHGVYANPNDSTGAFRPKAKINSSATTRRLGVPSGQNTDHGNTGPTARSESPAVKTIPRVRSTLSPKTASAAASSVSVSRTARVPAAASAPVTPESRRVQPHSAALASHLEAARAHEGGASGSSTPSFHATSSNVSSSLASDSSVQPRVLTSSKSVINLGASAAAVDRKQTSSPTLRIRSKVTQVARATSSTASASASESAPSTPPLPATLSNSSNHLYPSSRNITPRPRAPSSSSNVSHQQTHYQQQQPTSPPAQFYPITTAVSAANPHRYPSARPPPSVARTNPSSFQSFGSPNGTHTAPPPSSQSPGTRPMRMVNGGAKVDPALIPLPLNSPPASTVSFSSRSSASNSYLGAAEPYMPHSASSTDTGTRPSPSLSANAPAATDMRTTLDNLMKYTSEMHSEEDETTTSGGDDGDGKRTEKATAKSNRKIADLEITNRSLMAINMSLEATKHRQAKEIRELRRKLRETRLILPPRTYAQIKSSDGLADEEVSEDDDDEEDEDEEDADDTHGDEIYKRIKIIMENLLKSGEEALRAPASVDVDAPRNTTKVLTPAEVNDYNNSGTSEQDENGSVDHTLRSDTPTTQGQFDDDDHDGDSDMPDDDDGANSYLPSSDDHGNMTMTSEEEVEAMMHDDAGHRSSASPPPILITEPAS